jgi:hypothetical protein
MKKVNSFEHACEITGADPNIQFPAGVSNQTIAGHKLEVAYKASVGDFKPDFSNPNQWKYTPWLYYNPSLGAFVCSHPVSTRSNTNLGARFWFATRDAAIEFGNQHIELINQLHQ